MSTLQPLQSGVYARPDGVTDGRGDYLLVYVLRGMWGKYYSPTRDDLEHANSLPTDVSGWVRVGDLPAAPKMDEPTNLGAVVMATLDSDRVSPVVRTGRADWPWYGRGYGWVSWGHLTHARPLTAAEREQYGVTS